MVERASPAQNDSKRVSNFIEFRGIRRFICFGEVRWKKKRGACGRDVKKIISRDTWVVRVSG